MSRSRSTGLTVLFLCLVFLIVYGVNAQDLHHPRNQFQKRLNAAGQVDREEGLKPLEIAGETLTLVAVHLTPADLSGSAQGDFYRLGFYLRQDEARVTIKVRDYNKFPNGYHYWMQPLKTQYARGFQEFTWDTTVLRGLSMQLKDFGAVVSIGGYGYRFVAPVLLHTAPFPSRIRVQGCRFLFVPNETMDVTYSLTPKGQSVPVLRQSSQEKWSKDGRESVTWNGKNHQGHPAPEGLYVLNLRATVTHPSGRAPETISYEAEFYYTPEITFQR